MVAPNKRINKVALLLITFFLGGFGGHRFYQKKYGLGILYLLFCWTYIPGLVALIEFIIYCFKSEEELQQRYPETSGAAIVLAVVLPLVCLVIVGILAAIAIPKSSSYRLKAFNSAAKSDLKNCKTQAEAYFAVNMTYPVRAEQLSCGVSNKVTVYYMALDSGDDYLIISYHDDGDEAYSASPDSSVIRQKSKTEMISLLSGDIGDGLQGDGLLGDGFEFIE